MSYSDVVLADAPVAYYRHEEASSGAGLADSSGNGHNGTFDTFGTGPAFQATGRVGYAIDYAGQNTNGGDATLGTLGSLGSNLLTASVEFWFNSTDTTPLAALCGTVNDGTTTLFAVYVNSDESEGTSARKICFHVRDDAGNTQEWATTSAFASLLDGNWHHIACVVTSSTTLAIYIDGVAQAVTQRSGAAALTTFANFDYPMTLAARNLRGTLDRRANVHLDEVAFYSTRLSATRVVAHYNAGTGRTWAYRDYVLGLSGLDAYYRLGDTSGTTAEDASAANADGTYQPTYTLGQAGGIASDSDGAVLLNGSTGHVDIPNLAYAGDFSIVALVKLAGGGDGGDAIVGNGQGNGDDLNFTAGKLRVWDGIADRVVAATTVTTGWEMWVLTRESGTPKLYRNGSLDATGAGGWTATFDISYLGYGNAAGAGRFNGRLDEVALLHSALSSTQVTELARLWLAQYAAPNGIASGGAVGTPTVAQIGSYVDEVLALSGLQSYWRLDETSGNFTDDGPAGITGTPSGTGLTRGATGMTGDGNGALDYNGDGSHVNLGDVYDFAGSAAFSFAFLLKVPASGSNAGAIVAKDDDIIYWDDFFGGPRLSVRRLGGTQVDTATNALVRNTAHHIVVTYDTDQKIRMYVDSVKVKEQLEAASAVGNASVMRLGVRNGVGSNPFKGLLDEMAVFDRALTQAEITVLFNAVDNSSSAETIEPTAISTGEAIGTPRITRKLSPPGIVSPASFGAGSDFGTPVIVGGIVPVGIPSAGAVGTPNVTTGPPQAITDAGDIASAEAFEEPLVVVENFLTIQPVAIPPGAMGTPTVTQPPDLMIQPLAFGGELFGAPVVTLPGPTTLHPTAIASAAAFGTLRIWRATDPEALAPRELLYDPATDTAYEWAVNHSTEDVVRLAMSRELGAPNDTVAIVRQQSYEGRLKLHVEGFIFAEAQLDAFVSFFDACENNPIVYRDAAGDEYDVIISVFDHPRIRRQASHYWSYVMEFEVLHVRSGPFVGVT